MKIGFDAKRAAQNRTGLGNYSRFVLRILSQQHPENEYRLYMPNPRRTPFLHEIPTIASLRQCFPPKGVWSRLRQMWRVWGVTSTLRDDGIELFHGLSNELPLNIGRGNCRSVVTIHDLIFIHTPQYYHWIDRQIYNYKFRHACHSADRVIAVSQYTKREIMHYYGVAEEKIDVVYQGCDKAFAAELSQRGWFLSSANSINWGRLLPQIVYYFSAYCDAVTGGMIAMGDKLNFVVPTGNFGDILAGWYAKEMGLPVGKLICASNANNVLTDFIRTGTYNKNRPFHTTASPSMDILVSSNLERLLYALCGSDVEVAGYMQQLREQGSYTVSDALKAKIQEVFAGGFCNDIQTREKIGHAWRDHRYLIDTHTAVAYHVLEDYRRETGDTTPSVVVSTASPFKFCDQVLRGIGGTADAFGPALIRRLSCETQIDAPAPLTGLDARPVRFGGCVDKAQMLHTVDEFLK